MTGCLFSRSSRIWDDLAEARDRPGLVWNEQMGRWIVTRYDDIVQALHDPGTLRESRSRTEHADRA